MAKQSLGMGKSGMSYINENSFSRWIIEKLDGITKLGLQKLSKSVRDYAYLILTSQTSMRGPIVGHEARNLDAQRVFLNTFKNIINRRDNIPEDIRRFQKTLQYARSKVDYVIGEFIYMLPSDMNVRIGRVQGYNNKILVSRSGFKLGTNVEINLNVEKDKPDVKPKNKLEIKSNKEHKEDVKINLNGKNDKSDIESNREHKQDVKPNIKFDKESKPDTNRIIYEEEKVALVLGITSVFTVWWMFK